MKTLIKATAVTLALSMTTLYAGMHDHIHGDHGHSHTQKEVVKHDAKQIAKIQLALLTNRSKINKSWAAVPVKDIQKKKFDDTEEWVVSFVNKSIKKKSKQTIYIFISKEGVVTGANYTGK